MSKNLDTGMAPAEPRLYWRRVIVSFILSLGILAGAVGLVRYLVATKPVLDPVVLEEREWPISVQTAKVGSIQPDLLLYGQVRAGRDVELRALVNGIVDEAGTGLVDGAIVKAGDMLLRLDPFDFTIVKLELDAQLLEAEARLEEARAAMRTNEAALKQSESQLALRLRELDRQVTLRAAGTVAVKAVENAEIAVAQQEQDTVTRRSSLAADRARVKQSQAVIARLQAQLQRADRDLTRTTLTAPFDGIIYDVNAETGKRLSTNDRVARLVDNNRWEVAVEMSNSQYGRILASEGDIRGRVIDVVWRAGGHDITLPARIERVAAQVNAASGGVQLFALLDESSKNSPLRPGSFVEVRVPDRQYVDVVSVPNTAFYENRYVYRVTDNRLEQVPVEALAFIGDDVIIDGPLNNGDALVTTRFNDIAPGLKVSIISRDGTRLDQQETGDDKS